MNSSSLARSLALSTALTAPTAFAQGTSSSTLAGPASTTRRASSPPDSAEAYAARWADERALSRLMDTLDAEDRRRRIVWLVGAAGGATAAGLGVWMLAQSDDRSPSSNPGFPIVAFGGAMMVSALVAAAVPSPLYRVREEWEASAGLPIDARRARVGAALDEAANAAQRGRTLYGWGAVGLGVATLGVVAYSHAQDDGTSGSTLSSTALFATTGLAIISIGLYSLAVPSTAETARRFWDAGEARSGVRLAGASLLPTRGGALAGLALTF